MPLKFLGKILFPRHADWHRRKQMKNLIAAIVVGLIVAAAVAAVILYENSKK
jgi:hypothetical protein